MNTVRDRTDKLRKPRRYSRHPQSGYNVRGRVWVEKDGDLYLGWGRILLLENIDRLGSIAAAAKEMGLGYRNAWLWVESMNKLAPSPLVEKTTGGSGGGYARLTDEARRAITYYKELHGKIEEFLQNEKGKPETPPK
jgi:molybdate transport system regulatory protein